MHKVLALGIAALICAVLLHSPQCATAAAPATAEDEKEVIVQGVGANEESAKRQAYRNAVQNVVGAMVAAETLIVNDELVRDKVLSHSDGYITRVEQVGATRPMEGGLVEVTMKVTVKSGQLKEKLKAENITVKDVDGESLFTQIITKKEQQQDAQGMLLEQFKDFPANLLQGTADMNAAASKDLGNDAMSITIPVAVTVNAASYATFTRGLASTLEKMGFQREMVNIECKMENGYWRLYFYPHRVKGMGLTEMSFLVNEQLNIDAGTSRWSKFILPLDFYNTLSHIKMDPQLRLELLNGQNDVVTFLEQPINNIPLGGAYSKVDRVLMTGSYDRDSGDAKYAEMLFMPVPVAGKLGIFNGNDIIPAQSQNWNELKTAFTFSLSMEELRQIKNVRCSVYNKK